MSESRRPRLAVIVANGITGDSRVQKTALAAARDGWDVTLIGRAPGDRAQRSRMGPVRVLRVPVGKDVTRATNLRRRRRARGRVLQAGFDHPKAMAYWTAEYEARRRVRFDRINQLDEEGTAAARAVRAGLSGASLLDRKVHALRLRAYEWEAGRAPDPERAVGDWRRDQPNLLDLDLAFGPVIERLRPDVIHVNDITMLNTGAVAASRLRASGHRVSWVYDAHEYVAGVEWPTERMRSAYPALERELIHRADAVVTVSPEIAELIRADHHLPATPLVVRNTPVREAVGHGEIGHGVIGHGAEASVRARADLPADVPLMVYAGYIHAERGLDTAIDALPLMPDVHLAIVAHATNPLLTQLLRQAHRLGVDGQVHVVPYVAPQDVADYLSSADLGIICSKRTINYELSLPTKLSEYLHGGLPVVASDVRTLSAYVRDHEVGAVFEPGDAESFRDAVRAVLARRDEARKHITEEMLDDLSWERQSAGLLGLYRELSGLAPQPRSGFGWDVVEGPVHTEAGPAEEHEDADAARDLPWRELGRTPIRLGLGIANYAGQLSAIAQAVTAQRDDVSAEVTTRSSGGDFGYPSDVYVRPRDLNRLEGQLEQVRRVLPRYTHLIADAFLPVFGSLNGSDIAADLPALTRAGIRVALLGHGSEVRHPLRHMERVGSSHFHDAPEGMVEDLVRICERNREIADTAGLPVFVTTPDLLVDLPMATWIPLVVDVEAWRCDRPVLQRPRPVVLHAPSKRWTKGTDRFLADLEAMDQRGLIELRLVEGVPWSTMRDMVQDADIVVDQVAIGSYGTFACEAMAAGKPVIAHLTEAVLSAGDEVPPIVNARPDEVRAAVERLLDDRAQAALTGERSAAYARRVHDGTRSAQVLGEFLSR